MASATLDRNLFLEFRDWLVKRGWSIQKPACLGEALRASYPVAGGRCVKTIFGQWSQVDRDKVLFFDDAAREVNAFNSTKLLERSHG